MNEFLSKFADQFDETDPKDITLQTEFHDLDEWSSLTGLAVLNMISLNYGVKISPAELRNTTTVEALFNLVQSKK